MVLVYDTGKLLALNPRTITSPEKELAAKAAEMNFIEQDLTLPTEINPSLEKFIWKSSDGYILRTDTPFLPHINVTLHEAKKFEKVRIAGQFELG